MQQQQLINYLLHLADNTVVMGHRLSEWTGHGPVLEQDIAITNIALDHIGQARNFYQYAASLMGNSYDEDSLAYHRNENEFKNFVLVEQPNGDWAQTILKTFYISNYQYVLYKQLTQLKDEQLAAIAEKSLKEVTYHLRWSSEWVIRLGDGTTESHERMEKAINTLAPYIKELFILSEDEKNMGLDVQLVEDEWHKKTADIFTEATLSGASSNSILLSGKKGQHTEHLTAILNEMQYLQRTYPGCTW